MYTKHFKKYWSAYVTLGIVLFLIILSRYIPQETLRGIITQAGIFGPIIFIFLALLTYIIAPLSGTPMLLVGFYAFGPTVVIYLTIATIISSITNFLIARKWGRGFVEKFAGKGNMHKVDKFTDNYGLVSLFFSRVFLIGLHDIISYAAGLTDIAFSRYIVVSTLGIIPTRIAEYYIAGKIHNPVVFTLFIFVIVVIFSSIFISVSFGLTQYKKHNK
ncbi:hypothetical protein BH11PAT1_BH11PAT1_6290 [soil metagenome]